MGVTAEPDALPRGILHARIMHVRYAEKPYVLRHRLWFLHVPVQALAGLNRAVIGYNTWRPFTLRQRDYGYGDAPLDAWVRRAFDEAGACLPDGDIVLLTLPRLFGIGFNPVSFWLCHTRDGKLSAVLAEVNNTFGERHCYLVHKADGTPIASNDQIYACKAFHVSPFLAVEGEYTFRFSETADCLAIRVDLARAGKRVMSATINGQFAPLSTRALLMCFVRYPLPAVQVLGFIHYHAARLYLRGFKVHSKPPRPDVFISRPANAAPIQQGSEPNAL